MYARSPKPSVTPMCTFCKSIGKSEREYTSHFIHKTKSPYSRITCPELLKRVCLNCPGNNHTSDRCPNMNTVQVCFFDGKSSLGGKTSSQGKKETKNRFAGFEDDSDEEKSNEEVKNDDNDENNEPFIDLEMGIPNAQPATSFWEDNVVNDLPFQAFSINTDSIVKMDNRADQINYIGEEIYAQVLTRYPQRAGKITGMILELDNITELVYILETPELFNSMVAECIQVLNEPV